MPRLRMNPKFRRGFKTWADNQALEVRAQLGLKEHAPISAFDLCQLLKIPIYTPSDFLGLSDEYKNILLNEKLLLVCRYDSCRRIIYYSS